MAQRVKLRQRIPEEPEDVAYNRFQDDEHVQDVFQNPRRRSHIEQLLDTPQSSIIVISVITLLSLFLRLYKISNPDQVVFDEVHFGKFAAYYLQRSYYFDVHPPFAKLLFGLAGWFVGFDGSFEFENIGDSYITNNVPYVGMRMLPALLGTATVPLVYLIMKECGHSTVASALSAVLVCFDNAHVAQSRLILLDATLIFFVTATMYCYIKFMKHRYLEFTQMWWFWLISTGVMMACAWGSKVNGILCVVSVGIAVLIDLWDILDVRKEGHTMEYFWRHFAARALGFIIVPFIIYLSFFWVHFKVLKNTGPGDSFMSPAFQETLVGNELLLNSQEIRYYDVVTIKHKDTKVFLHSHDAHYPLRYDDGRISSAGQQVTGYAHADANNNWQIIPTKALPEKGRGRIVRNDDLIQLRHVETDTLLLTHDVASPLMPTNQEFTTVAKDDISRYNDTLFYMQLIDGYDDEVWKSKSGYFKLVHAPTKVSLWTYPNQLPDWAFKQQEVNGNKMASDRSATWYVDEIVADEGQDDLYDRLGDKKQKAPKKMSFIRKWAELQGLMLAHNAGLTQSHPYASSPINWPFLISGISFWTDAETQRQIYLIGNLVGWWICVVGLSIFVGILGADLLARRRAADPIPDAVRNRLWNSTGFFLLFWAVHYFPFFLMSRQLFIHHYLPSHLASALVAGSVFSFILSETINYPISIRGPSTRARPSQYADLGTKGVVGLGVVTVAMIAMFVFLSPLTYGTPGLTGEQVNARRLLKSWTLHFAAKHIDEVPIPFE
ncbi:glycosyltransferase family 39 protein [Schizophyllum commune]